ncbi:MAG: hypothetical protein HY996_03465 [Micrococcales bacterium]|nr:hypothetical protein [Micrococcales bacterium]
MPALPRVLDVEQLPVPELCAARLDGDLFELAGAWAPIDVAVTASDRAAAAASGVPSRWVAELGTASWIWGARSSSPSVPQFSAVVGERGPRPRRGVDLREVVIRSRDVAVLGTARVTTPARTIADLARRREWDEAEACRLAELGHVDATTLREHAARVRRTAHGLRAAQRLEALSRR